MVNLFDVDFSEPANRKAVAEALGQITGELYRTAPKRAVICYLRLLLSVPLWIYPIGRSHPLVSVSAAIASVAAAVKTSSDLEKLQSDIDDKEQRKQHTKVLQQVAVEQLSTTEQFAAVTQGRLQLSEGLPAHLVEPDLMPPDRKASDFEQFKAFIGDKAPASLMKSEAKTNTTPDEKTSKTAVKHSSSSQAQYRLYTRQNGRTNLEEQAVDLTGQDSYAGLPIVDVARLMAIDERGVLGVGSTGCGKSVLLANAIKIQQVIDSTTDFTVFAHKSANDARGQRLNFAGMEDSSDCIIFTATQSGETLRDAAERFEARLSALTALLEKGSLCTSVVVIDQSNQGLVACDRAYKQAKEQRAIENAGLKRNERDTSPIDFAGLQDDYSNFINSGLVDGREKAVKVWNLGHANTNSSMGVEHQIKRNVAYIGLGRVGNYQAVWNPLKDDRFIEDAEVREALSAQLNSFLVQHKANGSPANVVIAITNLGLEGWRLVVLPQYDDSPQITFNVVNPPQEIDLATNISNANDHQESSNREAVLKSLERSATGYTAEQLSKTRQLVTWLKSAGADYMENGVLHPNVYREISFIESSGEMQVCLDILCNQNAGQFVDSQMRWRPLGPLATAIANAPATPKSEISKEGMREVLKCLGRLQPGTIISPKSVLDNSRLLRPKYGMTVPLLNKVLVYLESRQVVRYPTSDRKVFEYRGGLDEF